LKTFAYTAGVIIVANVALGVIGTAQRDAINTPSKESILAAARAKEAETCERDGRLAARLANDRDRGYAKEDNVRDAEEAGLDFLREGRVMEIIDLVYASSNATASELQGRVTNQCMQKITVGTKQT